MKKLSIVFLCLLLSACQTQEVKETKQNACDAQSSACEVDDTQTTTFNEIDFDSAIAYFTNQKSGVLYFGFSDCPWCKEAAPVLKEVANEYDIDVQYVKTRDEERNLLYNEEQKAQITPYIQEYMSNNDEGVLTLYVPLVLVVKDGKVIDGHQGTLEEHNAKEREMTTEEKEELTNIYKALMREAS